MKNRHAGIQEPEPCNCATNSSTSSTPLTTGPCAVVCGYILRHDEHAGPDGRYTIRSLYFDNAGDTALLEKINGLNRRTKFRIRFYNSDPSFIHLEKKTRINGLSCKESAPITSDQCSALLAGNTGFLRSSAQATVRGAVREDGRGPVAPEDHRRLRARGICLQTGQRTSDV